MLLLLYFSDVEGGDADSCKWHTWQVFTCRSRKQIIQSTGVLVPTFRKPEASIFGIGFDVKFIIDDEDVGLMGCHFDRVNGIMASQLLLLWRALSLWVEF